MPTKANMVRKLVLEMAEANPSWGYGHIHGELKGVVCPDIGSTCFSNTSTGRRRVGIAVDPRYPGKRCFLAAFRTFSRSLTFSAGWEAGTYDASLAR